MSHKKSAHTPLQAPRMAQRMTRIQPFHVMAILAQARAMESEGRTIIHMEVGEPDFVTPQPIIDAGKRALDDGHTHYTSPCGLDELRIAIARHYLDQYAVKVSPQHIVITPGASGALQLALGTTINPGDQVLLADPGYPCNRNFVHLFGGEPVAIAVDASTNYQLNAALVKQHWNEKTKAVILASPSNPTGTLIDENELAAIINFVSEQGGFIIIDEIYHGLCYSKDSLGDRSDQQHPPSALQLINDDGENSGSDNVIVINSFSKYYGMMGWRLGWMVVPEGLLKPVDHLIQNIFLAAPTLAQYAALAAFEPETQKICELRRQEFQQRRDFLYAALRELGFTIPVLPQGAFYIYAGCQNHSTDSFQFCADILQQCGVAITPGIDFGTHQANTHVRFSYTTSIENLRTGITRLTEFLKNYQPADRVGT